MKDDRRYLRDIAERIRRIETQTQKGRDAFMQSISTQDAVLFNFAVIGEAAKQISQDLRQQHPDIPWREMARFRDFVIHHYADVILDEVWKVIEEELPALKSAIDGILQTLDDAAADQPEMDADAPRA